MSRTGTLIQILNKEIPVWFTQGKRLKTVSETGNKFVYRRVTIENLKLARMATQDQEFVGELPCFLIIERDQPVSSQAETQRIDNGILSFLFFVKARSDRETDSLARGSLKEILLYHIERNMQRLGLHSFTTLSYSPGARVQGTNDIIRFDLDLTVRVF